MSMYFPHIPHQAARYKVASNRDPIYAGIKSDIVALRLLPGVMLDESRLARQYGATRRPIREALRRLRQEGLVTTIRHRGSFVSAPTLALVLETDQVRLALEPLAARLAALRIDVRTLEPVEARFKRLSDPEATDKDELEFVEAVSRLNELVLAAAGSRHLRDAIVSLNNRISAVRLHSIARRFQKVHEEHRRLIAALKAGDGAAAEEAMRCHLLAAHENRPRLPVFQA